MEKCHRFCVLPSIPPCALDSSKRNEITAAVSNMEADWLSRTLSSIPNFDQIYLLAKDCRDALTTICKKIAGKLVQENALLKENNGLGCFLTLSNEADRLCGWIASLNDADLLKEALQTVITQSEDTEMKTDDKVAASFAQHATLSLLLLAAYLEQLEQRFGIGQFPTGVSTS